LSGSIEEIPLPDLLQLLSTSRKSGVLLLRSDGGVGKLYMRKGQITLPASTTASTWVRARRSSAC